MIPHTLEHSTGTASSCNKNERCSCIRVLITHVGDASEEPKAPTIPEINNPKRSKKTGRTQLGEQFGGMAISP